MSLTPGTITSENTIPDVRKTVSERMTTLD